MTKHRIIRNAQTGEVVLAQAVWCASFLCRLRGLMFRRALPAGEGLLFVNGGESVSNASIHMLFMRFNIGVVWMDRTGQVVDTRLAKVWRPVYAPKRAAQYYLEANVDILDRVKVGDVLAFDEATG
jgi:uncharacterized membrane protein (UPF0127 family)